MWTVFWFVWAGHRSYCNTEEKHEHRHLTQIQAIKLFMTGRRTHLKCKRVTPKLVVVVGKVTCVASFRWQRVDTGGVVRRCRHGSTEELLEQPGSQQIRVRTLENIYTSPPTAVRICQVLFLVFLISLTAHSTWSEFKSYVILTFCVRFNNFNPFIH